MLGHERRTVEADLMFIQCNLAIFIVLQNSETPNLLQFNFIKKFALSAYATKIIRFIVAGYYLNDGNIMQIRDWELQIYASSIGSLHW